MSSNDKNQVLNLYKSWLIDSFLLTGLGLVLGKFIPDTAFLFVAIAFLVSCLVMVFTKGKMKLYSMYAFNVITGMFLLNTLEIYAANDIFMAAVITIVVVGLCVYIATRPGKDYSGLGIFLTIALLGVIVYELIALFMALPTINGVVVVIFAFYTVYDVNRFKRCLEDSVYMSDEEIIMHVANFYLDVVNLFIRILSIVAKRDD